MKPSWALAFKILIFATLVFIVCETLVSGYRPQYEFHTGANGAIIWRCNTRSGQTEWASIGGKWKPVPVDLVAQLKADQPSNAELLNYITNSPEITPK